MSEDSTSPDPVELTRRLSAADSGEASMSFYGPNSVYDMTRMGMGVFEGYHAIRGFLEDWHSPYEEYQDELEEIRDLGNGGVFVVVRQNARPSGSPEHVRLQDVYGYLFFWSGGKISRATVYPDVEEARRAAESFAQLNE
jgi:ketosteroid isomerase-like protein